MKPELETRVRDAFVRHYGSEPAAVGFAPGRVNLIGEHVDYNDGLVLPMPVREGTAVAWDLGGIDHFEARAADLSQSDSFDPMAPDKPDCFSWTSYVRGMAKHWGPVPAGMRIAIAGDLPRGSGLSSSASLCVALAQAFSAARGEVADPQALALAAQRTEHEYAGVACGIMDQMAVAAGAAGSALLLDCRDLSRRLVTLPQDWAVMVVDSGVTRGLVDGEYNARRQQCEAAAAALGLASLRDADISMVEAADLPDVTARRARHVVSEIARVEAAAKAIAEADLDAFGVILREGHASLRDLFEVSHPEVDRLVAELDGAVGREGGARMTGAGFGGSVVAVLRADRVDALAQAMGRPLRRAF